NYAGTDESEYGFRRSINPYEVFSIIEARGLDEFENLTKTRKISRQKWNNFYTNEFNTTVQQDVKENKIEKGLFKKPTWLKQLSVFIQRDVLSKLGDMQYLLINFLEAPALAMILAYSIKYHEPGMDYVFSKNSNL